MRIENEPHGCSFICSIASTKTDEPDRDVPSGRFSSTVAKRLSCKFGCKCSTDLATISTSVATWWWDLEKKFPRIHLRERKGKSLNFFAEQCNARPVGSRYGITINVFRNGDEDDRPRLHRKCHLRHSKFYLSRLGAALPRSYYGSRGLLFHCDTALVCSARLDHAYLGHGGCRTLPLDSFRLVERQFEIYL